MIGYVSQLLKRARAASGCELTMSPLLVKRRVERLAEVTEMDDVLEERHKLLVLGQDLQIATLNFSYRQCCCRHRLNEHISRCMDEVISI